MEKIKKEMDGDLHRFLEFDLGKEKYAIPLLSVWEVIPVPDTTPIPKAPSHMLGIMNLRGQVITVIDLRKKLKVAPKEVDQEEAVIILDLKGFKIGVVVDAINRVLSLPEDKILNVPEVESAVNAKFISGVYQREQGLTILIDIFGILDMQEMQIVKENRAS